MSWEFIADPMLSCHLLKSLKKIQLWKVVKCFQDFILNKFEKDIENMARLHLYWCFRTGDDAFFFCKSWDSMSKIPCLCVWVEVIAQVLFLSRLQLQLLQQFTIWCLWNYCVRNDLKGKYSTLSHKKILILVKMFILWSRKCSSLFSYTCVQQ